MTNEEMKRLFSYSLRLRERLKQRDGTVWTKSHSEMHAQYGELPIFIDFDDTTDFSEMHDDLVRIVGRETELISAFQINVYYRRLFDGKPYVAILRGNDEVLRRIPNPSSELVWAPSTP